MEAQKDRFQIELHDSNRKNLLINSVHSDFENSSLNRFAVVNGEFAFRVDFQNNVPENTCYIGRHVHSLIFGMGEPQPAEIILRKYDQGDALEKIKFCVGSNQKYICKKILASKLKKSLLSQKNCYNHGEMFDIEYSQGKRIYKINLVARIQDSDNQSTDKKSWGFLTEKTIITFEKSLWQQFDLVKQNEEDETASDSSASSHEKNFCQKIGKKVGGHGKHLELIQKMIFNSRMLSPQISKKLGIKHVKGLLLYGPPGTGKTAIAREIAEMTGANVTIVNGPEHMDKYVGESQRKTREPYEKAMKDQEQLGENSPIYIIIYDEFDAICKKRGTGSTDAYNSVVNTILSKMDGVKPLNNILVIAMTNRKDLIDEALLRPGRIEVHVEISLPDQQGRLEIFNIHTENYRKNSVLDSTVDLNTMAKLSKNFTGSEIEGLVKKAFSSALSEWIENGFTQEEIGKKHFISQNHFIDAFNQIVPQFGADISLIENKLPQNPVSIEKLYPPLVEQLKLIFDGINNLDEGKYTILLSGSKKGGKTTLACWMAKQINFEFTKLINLDKMIGLGEVGKMAKLTEVYLDSVKCQTSCIVFDEIVDLIEYVPMDRHYSRAILQGFLQILKKQPEKGKKMIIIVTEARKQLLKQLGLYKTFDFKLEIPKLNQETISVMLESRGYNKTQADMVTSHFSSLSIGEVCSIVESSKNKKESLENVCKLLKMRQNNEMDEEI